MSGLIAQEHVNQPICQTVTQRQIILVWTTPQYIVSVHSCVYRAKCYAQVLKAVKPPHNKTTHLLLQRQVNTYSGHIDVFRLVYYCQDNWLLISGILLSVQCCKKCSILSYVNNVLNITFSWSNIR